MLFVNVVFFTKKYINELIVEDLIDLEKLLNVGDNNLYNFYNGLATEVEFEENNINSLFKNFKFNEDI